MSSESMLRNMLVLTTLLLITLLYIPLYTSPVYSQGGQFEVVGVTWGTTTSPTCVGPWMQAQMLTVTLMYNGNTSLPGLKAELYLPQPLRDSISKSSIATAYYMQPVVRGQPISLTFWIDVGNAAVGDYSTYMILYTYVNGVWTPVSAKTITISIKYTENLTIGPSIITAYPGYTNISIQLKNLGLGYAHGASLTVSSQSPQVSVVAQRIWIGEIPPQSSTNISIPLYISPALAGSIAPLSLAINYVDACGFSRSLTSALYLSVVQPIPPQIALSISPSTIIAGAKNNVTVSIVNNGSTTIKGITISFTFPQQVILVNGSLKWFIDELEPSSSASTSLILTSIGVSSSKSVTQITATVTYTDQYGISRSDVIPLTLTIVKPATLIDVDIEPRNLTPGSVNELTLIVRNVGNATAYGLDLLATLPQFLIFKDFDGRWYVGDLKPGEERVRVLTLIAPSTTSSAIQIPVTLSYADAALTSRSETRYVVLVVKPIATLLTTSIEPEQVTVGNNNITISVKNSGNISIYNVQAIISVQGAAFIGFDGKWRIGDLEPGEEKSITLQLATPSSSNTIQISVAYSYTDVGGSSRSENSVIVLEVLQPTINIAIWAKPQNLSIGDNNVTIYIQNRGNSTIYNTMIALTIPQQIALLNSDGRVYIGDVGPGETKAFSLHMTVASGSNVVQMPVTIIYTDVGGASRSENRVLSFRVAAQPTIANFEVSIEPSSIVSGVQSKLRVTVVNIASKRLDNISASISSQALAFVGFDGKWLIGSLKPGEARSIDLPIYINPVQTSQNIAITVVLTYIDTSTGSSNSESYTLTIIALPNTLKQPPEVSVYPQVLVAGGVNNLTMSIRNPNTFNISAIGISITPPAQTSLLASDTYFIPLLKPGDEYIITVPLYIPPTFGSATTSLAIAVSYFDGASTGTLSKSVAFLVALPPMLKVTNYAILPQTITPGQTFSVTLTIANAGIGTAYNVTVIALPSPLYTPLLGSQTFVGDLAKGASTTVTFSFRASSQLNATNYNITIIGRPNITRTFTTRPFPTVSRSIPYPNITRLPYATQAPHVAILITFMDNIGRKYNTTLLIPLTMVPSNVVTVTATNAAEGTFSNHLVLSLAVIVVVIVAITYVIIRVRKK
jgi:hypothetical protein